MSIKPPTLSEHPRPATSRRVAVGLPSSVWSAALGATLCHLAPALLRPAAARGLQAVDGSGLAGGLALTFDDGPDPHGTPAVLAALGALGWTATFFMLGSQVDRHPDVARAVADAGHEIAVHGWSHRNHLARSPLAVVTDVRRACASIRSAVPGVELRWFRPPYGVLSGASCAAARLSGLRPVLWSAWGKDWVVSTGSTVAATVMTGRVHGGTVLLHDSDATSTPDSWRATVASLPILAEEFARQGLAVRPLREHLFSRAPLATVSPSGPSWRSSW